MPFVVLKDEKELGDVVGRAFGKLSAAQARRAEAAILRANPRLSDPGEIKSGAVVVVPAIPGLRRAAARETEVPAQDVVATLGASLDDYRKELSESIRNERAAAQELNALLKSKELKAAARELPSERYLEKVAAAAKTRGEENERREAFLKLLAKAKADLDTLAKALG